MMQPLTSIRTGRTIDGKDYTPDELERAFPGGQWRGGYFFTPDEVARYTEQVAAEREPLHNPRAYLAEVIRKRGVVQPFTIDKIVKDVLAVAASEGKGADRDRLLELVEIELRARRQILEMAQARDARESETKKESPMSTRENASKSSPFAAPINWRKTDFLPDLHTIHTAMGATNATTDAVKSMLAQFLEKHEYASIDDYKGSKSEFLDEYRRWLPRADELSARANEEDAIYAPPPPPPPPAPVDWRSDEAKLAQFWSAVGSVHKSFNLPADLDALKRGLVDFFASRKLSGLNDWKGKAGEFIGAYTEFLETTLDLPEDESPAEPPAPKAPQNGQGSAEKRSEASSTVSAPDRAANPPQRNENGGSSRALITLPQTGDSVWETRKQQAEIMIRSGLLPRTLNTPEQVITIMMMADMLGLAPLAAINGIDVLQGKPTVKPQLMLALIRRSGHLKLMEVTDDGTTCTVKMQRGSEPVHVETFSMDDARALGLADKDNWRKQAKTMRKWRAIAAAARIVFPDVIWGMYTPEELGSDAVYTD